MYFSVYGDHEPMTGNELGDLGGEGLFTRWNNPTPPRSCRIPSTPLPSTALANSNPPTLTRLR